MARRRFTFRRISRKGPKEIALEVKKGSKRVMRELQKLGVDTAEDMKGVIKANKKREQAGAPTKLEDSITFEPFKDGGWGVGNIPKMDKEASYWKIVNDGGAVPGGGKYRPVEFTDGRPNPDLRGKGTSRAVAFMPISKVGGKAPSPIRPMDFIEKTYHVFRSRVAKIEGIILKAFKGK